MCAHPSLWAQAPGPKGWMNPQDPPPGRASLAPGHLGPHPKSCHTGPANPDPGHLLPPNPPRLAPPGAPCMYVLDDCPRLAVSPAQQWGADPAPCPPPPLAPAGTRGGPSADAPRGPGLAPTRTHSLEAMQLHQRLLVHHHGALQCTVEGLGHQPPTCPLRQPWAQQPQEPSLGGLCREKVRAASWGQSGVTRRAQAGRVWDRGLTFQHLLKLSQQGLLGDYSTGGSGGPRGPGGPRGAREASLGGGRRK